jgi:splicing factor 3B subunit 4
LLLFFLLVNVHIPKDKLSGQHQGYGFVEFRSEEDADYAVKIMNMIRLFGKPIRVNRVRNSLLKDDKKNTKIKSNYLTLNCFFPITSVLLFVEFTR